MSVCYTVSSHGWVVNIECDGCGTGFGSDLYTVANFRKMATKVLGWKTGVRLEGMSDEDEDLRDYCPTCRVHEEREFVELRIPRMR